MSKRKISIAISAVVILAVVGSLIFWKVRQTKAKAAKREATILKSLSDEDIALLVKSQAAASIEKAKSVVATTESRRAFLKGLKEYLSLAARARKEGFGEDQNFALNLQMKENGLLSELYGARLAADKNPFTLSKEQLKSFWEDAENQKQFEAEMNALYAVQELVAESMGSSLGKQPKPQGEGLDKAKKDWARARLLSGMARADQEFLQQKEVQLRLQVLEAGILSSEYLAKYWKDNIKATPADIKSYLTSHPEWDVRKKHETAEMVLKRARAGEDFAMLAKEFSEDRRTKDQGGLYDSFELGGGLWAEIEAAALKLQPGEIADHLIETHDGYHIVLLVDKTTTTGEDGKEKTYLSLRHILLQKRFEDPGPRINASLPPAFKTAEEIAKTAVEKEKRQRFVDNVVRSEGITLPEDFTFNIPDHKTQSQ